MSKYTGSTYIFRNQKQFDEYMLAKIRESQIEVLERIVERSRMSGSFQGDQSGKLRPVDIKVSTIKRLIAEIRGKEVESVKTDIVYSEGFEKKKGWEVGKGFPIESEEK